MYDIAAKRMGCWAEVEPNHQGIEHIITDGHKFTAIRHKTITFQGVDLYHKNS